MQMYDCKYIVHACTVYETGERTLPKLAAAGRDPKPEPCPLRYVNILCHREDSQFSFVI